MPIPSDLAAALKKYTKDLEPNDKVFPFPTTSGSIVDMLRRDLAGAGINWKLPTGEVIDFHTLRSTAITWWLTEDGLAPKVVQVLARLKTLALAADKAEIERRFGAELGWQRLDDKKVCRIRYDMNDINLGDEESWPKTQDRLIDTMIRFEKALRPSIQKLGM